MPGLAVIGQALRFASGLRGFLAHPITLADATAAVDDGWRRRTDRFLTVADELIWAVPSSPYRPLLAHAGIDRAALRDLVRGSGIEPALAVLRDEGVYVAYEEYSGERVARRGSAVFEWSQADFLNPVVRADYMGSTSGTRGGGTPVGKSFAHLRSVAAGELVSFDLWGIAGAPGAVWLPVLPSSAGLNNVLRQAVTGDPPERWFSHLDPRTHAVSGTKRIVNRVLPLASRAFGTPLPRPEHAPPTRPDAVLAWCRDALDRSGRASLVSYPTSAVALARLAVERGVALDGLVIRVGGEPVTAAKVEAVRASGALVANGYAFAQVGRVGMACPHLPVEELHAMEHHIAVIARRRTRADGLEVDALCWTSLDRATPSVFLNLESDDYAHLSRDTDACPCALGRIGVRTRIRGVRGLSKVVAGGITLPGERLEALAEQELPRRFGGGPGSYQFAALEQDGVSRLVVRVDPAIGAVDERAVADVLAAELRRDDLGLLAEQVWRGAGAVLVLRERPVPSRSGKLLTYEPLR